MKLAFVGCGYVADFYLATLPNHPALELIGVADCNHARAESFSRKHGLRLYASLEHLLSDDQVQMVINLTNPSSHYSVSRAALMAGKHVYSEKPLAMTYPEAQELVSLAQARGVSIAAAPCSFLSETAETVATALRTGAIGKVRLVYAELDDGALHQMRYWTWVTKSGIVWPYQDEFQVGCVFEHAAYHLSWLTAFFGPAADVTAFTACLVPHKHQDVHDPGPDFSVASIRFANGVVARLTCGTVAPRNHALTLIGDEGVLHVPECWHYGGPVYIQHRLRSQSPDRASSHEYLSPVETLPLVTLPDYPHKCGDENDMDYARGIAELTGAIIQGCPGRMTASHALHVTEMLCAIHEAARSNGRVTLSSHFGELESCAQSNGGIQSTPAPPVQTR